MFPLILTVLYRESDKGCYNPIKECQYKEFMVRIP